jgi:transcriptional regulator with XRE-family HTH domain
MQNGLMLLLINRSDMKFQNQFGKAFRQVRRARGLTQEDFSDESGRTYVSELERGIKHPTLNKIDELTAPLNLHPLTVLTLSYVAKDNLAVIDKLLAQVRREVEEVFQPEANNAGKK